MRKYTNQIDNRLLESLFTQEELENYKTNKVKLRNIKDKVSELEKEVFERLEGVVIGDLKEVEFDYIPYSDSFYIKYRVSNSNPIIKSHKKWYQFWK